MSAIDFRGVDAERPAPPHLVRAALHETRVVLALADRAYAHLSCLRSGACCQLGVTGRQPWLWPTEWHLLLGGRAVPPRRPDGACPFLSPDDRCSAYADRPFGCRTYFCSRAADAERHPVLATDELLRRLEAINQRVYPEAVQRPLFDWYAHR